MTSKTWADYEREQYASWKQGVLDERRRRSEAGRKKGTKSKTAS